MPFPPRQRLPRSGASELQQPNPAKIIPNTAPKHLKLTDPADEPHHEEHEGAKGTKDKY